MKIAVVCSNYFNIKESTANGTAIFDYSYIQELARRMTTDDVSVVAFASGASLLPVPIISIDQDPSSANGALIASGKNVLYEQTLLSKAFSMQDEFDLYHINIGDGDIALPFAPFVDRPIVITIHHMLPTDYMQRFFSFYRDQPNVFFISASDAQRTQLPDLRYLATIHHGVDTDQFGFDASGGESLMWAGRAIPEKGPDAVVDVAEETHRPAKLFGILRASHSEWLKERVLSRLPHVHEKITFTEGKSRPDLIPEYQSSKAFILPITVEESFGLVFIEAMSCGTPVIAYARGSVPEVIQDGVTGFIVNPSDDDIRGEWIIKKTGREGIREAVERLYALPVDEYRAMRRACRKRVESMFSIERMTDAYLAAYREAITRMTGR